MFGTEWTDAELENSIHPDSAHRIYGRNLYAAGNPMLITGTVRVDAELE